jgi:hypothetical protein
LNFGFWELCDLESLVGGPRNSGTRIAVVSSLEVLVVYFGSNSLRNNKNLFKKKKKKKALVLDFDSRRLKKLTRRCKESLII